MLLWFIIMDLRGDLLMLIHADREKLLELAKDFYAVCHTMISIYDANKKTICSYPDKMCDFCAEIRKSPTLTARCIHCDEIALAECEATRKTHSYKCHMGLIETAVPIISNDIVIGYILFGQITDNRDKSLLLKGLKEVALKHRLNYDTLKVGVVKIKYRSPQYISSISKLTEMCAGFIWQNSFIRIQKDTTAQALDLFLRENLRQELSVPMLCRQFGISRSSLYTLSREHFGCGVSEYISKLRVEAAKTLLSEGLSVGHTAEKVGVRDVNYFIRMFKAQEGTTPKQWVKQN